jgi:hypothetical protein
MAASMDAAMLRRTIAMTELKPSCTMVGTYAAGRRSRAARRRHCVPGDHLVTVVGAPQMRDGEDKTYWIRCRKCDLEHGPYGDWQAAWHDAWRAQIAVRRLGVSLESALRPISRRVTR